MSGLYVGDIPHLIFRNVQQLGQLRPVRGGLIQQHQKLTVGEHEPGSLGAQALLHVLSGGGQRRAILTEPLPRLIEELGGVVIFEEQIHLVHEDPSIFSRQAVRSHPVLNGLHGHVEGGGLQLFPHLIEVKDNEPVVHVHIGLMGEHIQGALHEQLGGQGQLLRLPFRLALDLISPVG